MFSKLSSKRETARRTDIAELVSKDILPRHYEKRKESYSSNCWNIFFKYFQVSRI